MITVSKNDLSSHSTIFKQDLICSCKANMSQRSKNTETTTGTPAGGLIFGWICHPFLLETGATSCISFELNIYIYIYYYITDILVSCFPFIFPFSPLFLQTKNNLFHPKSPTKNWWIFISFFFYGSTHQREWWIRRLPTHLLWLVSIALHL